MTQEAWQMKDRMIKLLEVNIGEYIHDFSIGLGYRILNQLLPALITSRNFEQVLQKRRYPYF